MNEPDRAEIVKALRDVEQHAREMFALIEVHGLPLTASHHATTIATRLALIDRLVRKV